MSQPEEILQTCPAASLHAVLHSRRSGDQSYDFRRASLGGYNPQEEVEITNPRESLRDPVVTNLLQHYIEALAPWYDLMDPHSLFAEVVPLQALDSPILFKAIIAFSASHQSKTREFSSEEVLRLHDACLKDLIAALENIDLSRQAEYLAAACLLRSYEILNGDTRNQHHLLGAYSFAAIQSVDLETWGLVQAGFWNYLREDITVALEFRRPLHMKLDIETPIPNAMTGLPHDHANRVTYLLAKIINFCWGNGSSAGRTNNWRFLSKEMSEFQIALPRGFSPYSSAPKPESHPLPSTWALRPYHVSTNQYLYIAKMLLHLTAPPDSCASDLDSTLESLALDTIALSSTNPSVPARVNAFGPLSFCGRYLRKREHRRALRALLRSMAKETGWNVEHMIRDLCECWGARDLED